MRSGTEGTYNGLNYASWGTKRHLDDSKVHSSPCLTPVCVAWRSKEYWLNPPPSGWNVSPSQVIALQRSVKLLQHSLELIYIPGLREVLKESDDLAKEHKKGPKRGLEFLTQIPAHDALRHLRFPLERKGYTEIFLNLLKLKMVFQHVKIKIHSTIYTVKKSPF